MTAMMEARRATTANFIVYEGGPVGFGLRVGGVVELLDEEDRVHSLRFIYVCGLMVSKRCRDLFAAWRCTFLPYRARLLFDRVVYGIVDPGRQAPSTRPTLWT